jgi:hypothetical protein
VTDAQRIKRMRIVANRLLNAQRMVREAEAELRRLINAAMQKPTPDGDGERKVEAA